MRINGSKYMTMKNGLKACLEYHGVKYVRRTFAGMTVCSMLWDCWHTVSDNLRYDDKHPMFRDEVRGRFIPDQPNFDVYSDGIHDSHISTALLKIAREIGLVEDGVKMSDLLPG